MGRVRREWARGAIGLRGIAFLALAWGCAAGQSIGQQSVAPPEAGGSSSAAIAEPSDVLEPIDESLDAPLDAILYPPPIAPPGDGASHFGLVVTDDTGRRRVVPAREIPNRAYQAYGWAIPVGASDRPVAWVETIRAARDGAWSPGDAQRIVEIEAHGHTVKRVVSVSADGRTRTTRGESVPAAGFLQNASNVHPGAPSGDFEILVSLPDGRTERFEFALGEPQGVCPYSLLSLQWWQNAEDPRGEAVSERVLLLFGGRLVYHGFVPVDDVRQAHWVAHAVAMQGPASLETFGFVGMRAVADFLGAVMRYDLTTPGATRDYSVLFSKPTFQLDGYVRGLADEFAANLTPYRERLCADWSGGRFEEEARLEKIRRGLVEEIQQIRRQRSERQQQKRLEMGVDPQP